METFIQFTIMILTTCLRELSCVAAEVAVVKMLEKSKARGQELSRDR
jgi:hypothetical protein